MSPVTPQDPQILPGTTLAVRWRRWYRERVPAGRESCVRAGGGRLALPAGPSSDRSGAGAGTEGAALRAGLGDGGRGSVPRPQRLAEPSSAVQETARVAAGGVTRGGGRKESEERVE